MGLTYAEWLASGPKGVRGVIDIANFRLSHGYIQPADYPEERLFFSYKDWPFAVRNLSLVDRDVFFDVAPQDFREGIKPVASNVRFVPEERERIFERLGSLAP